jgi:hypothetical protein
MTKHLHITLNMNLDRATEIVDTSQWTVREDSVRDSGTFIMRPCFAIRHKRIIIVSGFNSREQAEASIRDWNTPEARAERVAFVRSL